MRHRAPPNVPPTPAPRRVVIARNAASGRGAAAAAAESLARDLQHRGHSCLLAEIRPGTDPLPAALRGADALVVAGGDGTLNRALAAAVASGAAVYHLPLGTENLFAREFRMTRRDAAAAVDAWRVDTIDLGRCHGRWFAIMAGLGLDAEVVRRLDAARRGPIRRRAYLGPTGRALLEFRPPPLTVHVDGRPLVHQKRGSVVVANARRYGGGLNPAPRASPRDGLLDAVFIPHAGPVSAALRLAAARARLLPLAGAVRVRGAEVRILAARCAPVQVDGEPFAQAGAAGADGFHLLVEVAPRACRVLLPPDRA